MHEIRVVCWINSCVNIDEMQQQVMTYLMNMDTHECVDLLNRLINYPLRTQDDLIFLGACVWSKEYAQEHLKWYITWMTMRESEIVWQYINSTFKS